MCPFRPCPGDSPRPYLAPRRIAGGAGKSEATVSEAVMARGLSPGHGQNRRVTRIHERLESLYAIGATRVGYSAEEDAAHRLFAAWLREDGLEVEVDADG